ncbi:MAG TPA: ABC transporter ATP-binding protein [Opitutales bacterium]|jgi:ABC-2 type transport system ATP-binding protein|nr:ABC transporter ATP-binding protein [Opitutales bacterium]
MSAANSSPPPSVTTSGTNAPAANGVTPAVAAPPVPSLQAIGLYKDYGSIHAVQNMNFTVGHGEIVGFLGPNGAGKSTTMRIFAGLLSATSGRAYVNGISVARYPDEAKRHLGYMPEHNPLPDDMRVLEYLNFRARLKGIPRREIRARVEEVVESCGLQHKTRRKLIGSLSKGYRQRVGIADAILAKPEVILMDEPTIGLDPIQIQSIRRLIDSLRGRHTVLISSHILPEIEMCCDRVMIINQGRLVASGTSKSLRRELLARCEWRVRLSGDVPSFEQLLPHVHPSLRLATCSAPDPDGFVEIHLEGPVDGPDLGETLLTTAMQRGAWRIREFSPVEPGLEEIFLAATKTRRDTPTLPEPKK